MRDVLVFQGSYLRMLEGKLSRHCVKGWLVSGVLLSIMGMVGRGMGDRMVDCRWGGAPGTACNCGRKRAVYG